MSNQKAPIFFSDFFQVDQTKVEEFGAFDISLVSDLPLFIDPFLLFNSENEKYQELHKRIIDYVKFLRDQCQEREITEGHLKAWFMFPEVKQNWLGFSTSGNRGHGLGSKFADALHDNLLTVFKNFGDESITKSSHLEKLCLIRDGVGRDNISDFTTNLILDYLATFTETFAKKYLHKDQVKRIRLREAKFNFATESWQAITYELPYIFDDYVILTPRDILTKDESWINRPELINRVQDIADALPNAALRDQINAYISKNVPLDATRREYREVLAATIDQYPDLIDHYIKDKEENQAEASSSSQEKVEEVTNRFVRPVKELLMLLAESEYRNTDFSSHAEALRRANFLKDVIENKGGHKLFYLDGAPLQREADLQILYRMVWYASFFDVSSEVNDGRGPADFKISYGARDKTIVEFKLAKNAHLKRNLISQTQIYEKASDATNPSIKVIFFFSLRELKRVQKILRELNLEEDPNIVLIDASPNKPSGSKA